MQLLGPVLTADEKDKYFKEEAEYNGSKSLQKQQSVQHFQSSDENE